MLIPCKHTVTTEDVARLFIRHWYPIAGLPKTIMSERDAIFTSHFWKAFFTNFGTKLQLSIAFHPQTDGQQRFMIKWLSMCSKHIAMTSEIVESSICHWYR